MTLKQAYGLSERSLAQDKSCNEVFQPSTTSMLNFITIMMKKLSQKKALSGLFIKRRNGTR